MRLTNQALSGEAGAGDRHDAQRQRKAQVIKNQQLATAIASGGVTGAAPSGPDT
jgi:hypothetical protein